MYVSGLYLSRGETLDVLISLKIAYDLRVRHDFDPMPILIEQVIGKKEVTIRSGLYLSYEESLDISTSHKDCFPPEGVS